MRRILVIGYGNPGRQDDGLGPALAERIEALALPGVTVLASFQLAIEDAVSIAAHDAVVFVDAAVRGRAPYGLRSVVPARELGFSSHILEPTALMALAGDHFDSCARGFVLAIRGYEFGEFAAGLSLQAQANLDAAVSFILPLLREGGLSGAARGEKTAEACRARASEET